MRLFYIGNVPGTRMIAFDQKGAAAFDGKLVYAANDAAHGVVRQRPHGIQPVFLSDRCFAVKNRRARQTPVYNLSRRTPGKQFAGLYFFAASRCMCPCRPYNGLPVAAGNQHEAFPGGRGSVVRRYKLAVFDGITEVSKLR